MGASIPLAFGDTWTPRGRKPTPGPEAELLDAALASYDWEGRAPVVFREPQMPTGFPDVIAVLLRDRNLLFNPARLKLREEHLRLLHHVHAVQRTSESRLATSLRLKPAKLSDLLVDLEAAGLIRRADRRVAARSLARAFVARHIVAVEAKIRDWHRAIEQAVANTWFASHSYVLLPEKSWSPALRDRAIEHGVGVIVYDGQTSSIRLGAEERAIPASYGSWLVNEWTLRHAGRPAIE